MALRIVFMGTPDFAAQALQTLLRTQHEIVAVYSQPPRAKGRGQREQKSPVHELALQHNIPVFTPISLKKDVKAREEFLALRADIAVVAAYGLILPKDVLEAPRYGCLNIHASLLPRWRGASPIQRTIWAGDEKSGVTIMQMDEGLDTGDMIAWTETPITSGMTSAMLHDVLAKQGAELIVQVLDDIAQHGKPKAQKQDESLVTYAHLLKKDDGKISWTRSATEIEQQVRALNPWPGVFATFEGRRFKILQVEIAAQQTQEKTGTIIDRAGHVACGDGSVLRIITLQPEAKQAMDFTGAVNGGYLAAGKSFL